MSKAVILVLHMEDLVGRRWWWRVGQQGMMAAVGE